MSLRVRLLLLACLVEGGLLLLAVLVGALFHAPPFLRAHLDPSDLGLGLLATAPLLALFYACVHSSAGFCVRIRELLERSLMPLFERSSALDVLLISALAGLGEEALFRGVLQVAAERALGSPAALVVSSLLFGLAHAVTLGYAVLASVMGLYLGLLFVWTGELWIPIVAHAAYDFVALLYLRRRQSGVSMLLFCFGGASFLSMKKARLT